MALLKDCDSSDRAIAEKHARETLVGVEPSERTDEEIRQCR